MAEQEEVKQDPTPKTEEQIRAELKAEYDKIADQRVSEAIKKHEKKWADKLSADKQAQEQEALTKQTEQAKADEAKERDIITKSLKLAVVDALQELGLAPSLHNMIIVEDLVRLPEDEQEKKLTARIVAVNDLFHAEVNKQVQEEKKIYLRGTTPRTGNAGEVSRYDTYRKTGNVSGMISEKMRAYRADDD